ncbi:hypothetical protein EV356DRAFT_455453 [Viridothelium virens]|uniref:Uncharacterized protein n=1 Tax=Viridothelium virens TaxID=1048519 RepID=A0A6A6GVR3_VIRVR|nr:hypothetical protein EV356DRAFT_455453 [Viridothelium virens]
MPQVPVVLRPVSLLLLLEYVLQRHAEPTTILVCSSREVLLRSLLQSVEGRQRNENSHDLLTPTLQLLKASRAINMAYCPSVQVLQAWLCSYITQSTPDSNHGTNAQVGPRASHRPARVPMLVVVNPIALHRETSAYSAQGLSRAFAAMVEAASKTNRRLVIGECSIPNTPNNANPDEDIDRQDEETTSEAPLYHAEHATVDPWEEDLSILNVTTKSFGAGERGWVGRTVKIGQVVGRWCQFESPF